MTLCFVYFMVIKKHNYLLFFGKVRCMILQKCPSIFTLENKIERRKKNKQKRIY